MTLAVDVVLDCELADVPDRVRALEEAGAAGVFTYEAARDPFLPLAVAAPVSGALALYTNLAIALPRSPMTLAQQAWDLQRASGGRFMLGMGTQVKAHVERRFGSRWESPVEQMREWLLAMRAIMRTWQLGEPLDFEGRWTRHTYMTPFFNPGPLEVGPPPFLIGAVGPLMLRMATEAADGLLVHPFASERSLREHTMPAIAAGLAEAGRTRADFQIIGQGIIAVGRTDEEVATLRGYARSQVGFYGSTPAYRVILDVHGWGELHEQLHDLVRQQRWADLAAAVPDEVVDAFVCAGDPATVAAEIRCRYAAMDRLAMSLFADSDESRFALLDALR